MRKTLVLGALCAAYLSLGAVAAQASGDVVKIGVNARLIVKDADLHGVAGGVCGDCAKRQIGGAKRPKNKCFPHRFPLMPLLFSPAMACGRLARGLPNKR